MEREHDEKSQKSQLATKLRIQHNYIAGVLRIAFITMGSSATGISCGFLKKFKKNNLPMRVRFPSFLNALQKNVCNVVIVGSDLMRILYAFSENVCSIVIVSSEFSVAFDF